jgi:hypothetical protein
MSSNKVEAPVIALGKQSVLVSEPYPPRTAPMLGPISLQSSGALVALSGVVGQTVSLQASTDLTNWIVLTNVNAVGSAVEILDTSATNFSRRFYRAQAGE